MGSLRVDVDNLTSVTITSMQQEKTKLDSCYEDMASAVQSLVDNEYMQSKAANAYVEEFNSLIKPDVEALSNMVETYYTQLSQICEAFTEGDRALADFLNA